MKRGQGWYSLIWLLLSFSLFVSVIYSSDTNMTADDLDSIIQNHAFRVLIRHKTGVVYPVQLPEDLSGVSAAVIRVKSKMLWLNGVNIGSIQVPPKTIAIPQVRRLIIVYQDLGDRSTSYYAVQNYTLATPVIGLLAYDASDLNSSTVDKLDITVRGNPIVVKFPEVHFPKRLHSNSSKVKCMRFGYMSLQSFTNRSANDECSVENGGHFAILAPSDEFVPPTPAPSPSGTEVRRKRKRKWVVWVVGFGGGFIALIVLFLLGAGITKLSKRRREGAMRRKAEEGEVLEDVWVNGSRMPSASTVRTQPALEQGSAP